MSWSATSGYWATRHSTADGVERTFAVNHRAPFLLVNPLLDPLRQCSARVVTVSSGAQAIGAASHLACGVVVTGDVSAMRAS